MNTIAYRHSQDSAPAFGFGSGANQYRFGAGDLASAKRHGGRDLLFGTAVAIGSDAASSIAFHQDTGGHGSYKCLCAVSWFAGRAAVQSLGSHASSGAADGMV